MRRVVMAGLKELKQFHKLAGLFESDVRSTDQAARQGNVEVARKAFHDAEERCKACHTKFRD